MSNILLTGGGTLGPVTPLLAVAHEWRKRQPGARLSWIGTPQGPERTLVEASRIPFFALAAPKFDRHRPWLWPFIPGQFLFSFFKAWQLLTQLEPTIIFTAGAYVSVPIVIAAWLKRVPVWLHQLDVVPGLANRLMAPFAKKISVTWPLSAASFAARKTTVVGAMAREQLLHGQRERVYESYGFESAKPTVLVIGGGTGAASLNQAMAIIGQELTKKANVIHLTGQGKMLHSLRGLAPNYAALEFAANDLADLYAASDVVVARAGMGTITELAALGKAAILVPLPGSQQVANAQVLAGQRAAEFLSEFTPQSLRTAIERLLEDSVRRTSLGHNIRGLFPVNADARIVHEAMAMIRS